MLLQNPQTPALYPPGYYFSWDFPVWVASIIIGFIGVIIFYGRGKKAEIPSSKALFFGIAILYLFLALTRICFIVAVWSTTVSYDSMANYGYIFEVAGITCLFFEIERAILKQTHFGMTIFSFIGILVGIFTEIALLDRDVSRILSTLISSIDTILIILIFLYLVKTSTGSIRRRTTVSFIGIVCIFVGWLFDSEIIYEAWPTQPILFPPILTVVGLLIIIVNQKTR